MSPDERDITASRIAALIAQASSDLVSQEIKPLAPFFETFAEGIVADLQNLTDVPVKLSVAKFTVDYIDTDAIPPHRYPYQSGGLLIHIYFKPDRGIDAFLCEICLGGAGAQQVTGEEAVRPSSKLEMLLREKVFDAIHACLPKAVGSMTDLELIPGTETNQSRRTIAAKKVQVVVVHFLANAFSLSTEIVVMIPLEELEAILGPSLHKVLKPNTRFEETLSLCPFEIEACLGPQFITLDRILEFDVGTVVKLDITPRQAAILRLHGQEVGRGTLRISPQAVVLSVQ